MLWLQITWSYLQKILITENLDHNSVGTHGLLLKESQHLLQSSYSRVENTKKKQTLRKKHRWILIDLDKIWKQEEVTRFKIKI